MSRLSNRLKAEKKKIVFTNGCFDILHYGHVTSLEQAKMLGDVLVIGVNTDESVKSHKGDKRPVMTTLDRLRMLAALECVDYVVEFHERLPNEIIRVVRPDIHVKSGDYTIDQLPEAKVVEELGGKVIIVPFAENYSTTSLIKKILDIYLSSAK
jgi:D-beta-D-heptose 7-phosphate kinase/D-beta-D-heptose 1-phosphate adenosyltransferase